MTSRAVCAVVFLLAFSAAARADTSSDAQFEAQFRCPESLPDSAREQAVRDYFAWVSKAHPDWTVQQVLETRYHLLEAHHCEATLRNIHANSKTTSPALVFAGETFDFHDQQPIRSGSALYYTPGHQDPDRANQTIIVNYYNAKLDDGRTATAEGLAKDLLQHFSSRGGTVVSSFAAPDKSGDGKLTYFIVSYYIYPSDGNADIWFSKIEERDGRVIGILYKHQISGAAADDLTSTVKDWLRQNLKTYGSAIAGLAPLPKAN